MLLQVKAKSRSRVGEKMENIHAQFMTLYLQMYPFAVQDFKEKQSPENKLNLTYTPITLYPVLKI